MGKPFAEELEKIASTLEWCSSQPLDALGESWAHPVVAVGAGGSYSAAVFVAACAERQHGTFAVPMTPLEYVQRAIYLPQHTAWLLSAEGKNADILQAAATAIERSVPIKIVTFAPEAPLVKMLSQRAPTAKILSLVAPWGKDGYLATNSLIATGALVGRHFGFKPEMLEAITTLDRWRAASERALVDALAGGQRLLVLHALSGMTAAVDAESKFAEAALGTVQRCDLRQFAHGRHIQLAQGDERIACMAIISVEELDLWMATRRELPADIAVSTCLTLSDPASAALTGLCAVYGLVQAVAQRKQVDPGEPTVPAFARRLHALRTVAYQAPAAAKAPPGSRKVEILLRSGFAPDAIALALSRYRDRLGQAQFCGVALDFDGTCCETSRRLDGIETDLAFELTRLARLGIKLGFATGRGDSLHANLRSALPADVWQHVVLACHSGSTVLKLSDPWRASSPEADLVKLLPELHRRGITAETGFAVRAHGGQLTVEHRDPTRFAKAALILNDAVSSRPGWRLFRPAHSMDVLLAGTTKTAVIDLLLAPERQDRTGVVLRIGDRGEQWGNDSELLRDPFGISVDGVSPEPDVAWDAWPFEVQPPRRTLGCLQALEPHGDGLVGLSTAWLDEFVHAHSWALEALTRAGRTQ